MEHRLGCVLHQYSRLLDELAAAISFIANNSTDLLKGSSQNPQAIVILGGRRRKAALETPPNYQQQDLSSGSIERLRYGARLARQTKLPILVTGGRS